MGTYAQVWSTIPRQAPRPRVDPRATRLLPTERAYYIAFVISLILCWLPFKIMAYAAPILAIVIFLISSRSGRSFQNTITWLALFTIIVVAWSFVNRFVLTGGVLWLLTHSSFLFLLIVPNNQINGSLLNANLLRLTRYCVVFEACVGLFQAIYGQLESGSFDVANGDLVQGTIYPYLRSDQAFANPMFGASMTLLLLALVGNLSRDRAYIKVLTVGIISVVLASVMHQLIFLLLSLTIAFWLIRPKLPVSRATLAIASTIALVPLLTFVLLPDNLNTLQIITSDFTSGQSPRWAILDRVLFQMPAEYPELPVFGVGPGQFSSRAALINSGYYFGSPIAPRDLSPFLKGEIAEPLEKYLLVLWVKSTGNKYYGSSQKPYFSWLSIYAELGGIVLLLIVGSIAVAIRRVMKSKLRRDNHYAEFAWVTSALFLCMLGFQENYFEVPQALFPGLMLMKAGYAKITLRTQLVRKRIV